MSQDLFITCKLCGQYFEILGAHLSAIHGISTYQYKEVFPGEPTQSEHHRRVLSESHEGLYPDDEHRQAVSEGLLRAFEEDPSYADRISESLLGIVRDEEYGKHASEGKLKAYRDDPTYRKKLSRAQKELWSNPDYARRVLKAQRRKPNKVEAFLDEWLNRRFPGEWKYVGDGQVWIGARNPDFININGRKVVVELFGTRFHDIGSEDGKIAHYKKFGFDCIIIWADEWADIVADWSDIVRRLLEV